MTFDLNSIESRIVEITNGAKDIALHAALKIGPDYEKFDYSTIPKTFSDKWFRGMLMIRERLCEKYGENADALVFFSKRFYIFAIEYGYAFAREFSADEIAKDFPEELILDSKILTPGDYAEREVGGAVLQGALGQRTIPQAVLRGTPFTDMSSNDDVLKSISLHWFFVASNSYQTEPATALDVLFESSEALAIADGFSMWAGARENSHEEARRAGESGAQKRHAPMRQLEQWAVSKYREQVWDSASHASHELKDAVLAESRRIGANLKPSNSQRTIYDWILKANKKHTA